MKAPSPGPSLPEEGDSKNYWFRGWWDRGNDQYHLVAQAYWESDLSSITNQEKVGDFLEAALSIKLLQENGDMDWLGTNEQINSYHAWLEQLILNYKVPEINIKDGLFGAAPRPAEPSNKDQNKEVETEKDVTEDWEAKYLKTRDNKRML